MNIIKILYIITLSELGGAQSHLHDLITNLPSNIDPYLVAGKRGWLTDELEAIGVKVEIVETLVRHISPVKDIKAIFDIKKIIERINPDIVHCHSSKAGFIGRIAAEICGVKSVFTAHGWAFTEGVPKTNKNIYSFLEKSIANWTAKIICVSEYDRKLALQVMPRQKEKLVAIHNCIPDKIFAKNTQINDQETIKLIMVGRFSPQKNFCSLLRALSILKKEQIIFETSLVGEGTDFIKTKDFAQELDLSTDVKFLGARTDVDKLLVEHDVFLLITNWEGFPITILEAMREGLPIIASDVGGVSEAVRDNVNGFLVPRNDDEKLVACLRKINSERTNLQQMGVNSRNCFEKNFVVKNMLEKTLEVYESVLTEK